MKDVLEVLKTNDERLSFLSVLDTLIVLMKKFGKQLSQQPIYEFAQNEYPEAMSVYKLLGGMRLTVKDCLLLKQYLYESLGDHSLVVMTTDKSLLEGSTLGDTTLVMQGGDMSLPSLKIASPSKIYKRSLSVDLKKMLGIV